MLFECLDLWVATPGLQTGELALSSIQRKVDSVFEWMLGSAILQPILPVYLIPELANGPYMQPVRTGFCCCVMANLSSGMCLLLKNDTNK